MTSYVMGFTSSGGIPLFSRKRGEGEALSFSKMASFNGVHMFLKSHNIELIDTETPDTILKWKEFEETVLIIVMASGTTKIILNKFLDAIFNAMVLVVGIDDIKNPRSIERLKRDLRVCNPIIDRLLECLDTGDKTCMKIDSVDMTSCNIYSENHLLQVCLDSYMELLDSMYGCVLIHGCLAVATENWWHLDPIERKLLILAITLENNCIVKDLPVFLPNKSPSVAFRLVSVSLGNHVEVLSLCGPTPSLIEIERLAVQTWRSNIDVLKDVEQIFSRNFFTGITLEPGILGFFLANYKVGKFILTRNPQQAKNRTSGNQRLESLRTFYHHAVEIFLMDENFENDGEKKKNSSFEESKETYWCSEHHKCHAFKEGDNIFCVLYPSNIPAHTMRLITQKTLKAILAEKHFCW